MTNPSARQAAHVLLDAISAWQDDATDDVNARTLNLATARLGEIDCVTATVDDNGDLEAVDVSQLVGATLVLLRLLVGALAEAKQVDREVVVGIVRDYVDVSLAE